jgi:hypothetical protein
MRIRIRRFDSAYKILWAFMEQQVAELREEIRAELTGSDRKSRKKDVFSMLGEANEIEKKGIMWLDSELVRFSLASDQCIQPLLELEWKYFHRSLRWAW